MQIVRTVLCVWQRPIGFTAPFIHAHHKDHHRRFLVDALPRDEAGLSAAARALGMSTRTLQRRVRERGVVYAGLVDDVRRHLSRKYLADGNLSLGEIAYLLGFSDQAHLTKAFSFW